MISCRANVLARALAMSRREETDVVRAVEATATARNQESLRAPLRSPRAALYAHAEQQCRVFWSPAGIRPPP